MRRYVSPLRYPGGKARLTKYLAALISGQPQRLTAYAEPFAGGAGAALSLLTSERVERIYLNDLDAGIAAFWRSLFSDSERFARKIERCRVDLESWHAAKAVYGSRSAKDDFDLGFATFFLNRTNRSGILGARPIGGLEQEGRWKIDARFNRADLADRVRFLGDYADRVEIYELDVLDFLQKIGQHSKTFLYVDPPYRTQGSELYLDFMSYPKHVKLARVMEKLQHPWMITYDADLRVVQELYPNNRCGTFDIAHTAARQHVGNEFVVFGNSVRVESLEGISVNSATWLPSGFRASTETSSA